MNFDFHADQIRTAVLPENSHRKIVNRSQFTLDSLLLAAKDIYNRAVCLSRSARIFMFSVSLISGLERSSGQPIKMLYIGEPEIPRAAFGKLYPKSEAIEKYANYQFIVESVYSDYKVIEKPRQISGINIAKTARAYDNLVDLVFIDTELLFSYGIARSEYLAIPQWLEQKLLLGETWNAVLNTFSGNLRKELKRVLKRGYEYIETNSRGNIELFYDDMYLPYVSRRFGSSAVPNSRRSIMRDLSGNSDLLLLFHDKQPLCGVLQRYKKDQMISVCSAVAPNLMPNTAKGALTAMDYFSILRAFEKGYNVFNFMGSRPLLESGIFHYKRKWGSRIAPHPVPLANFYLKLCNLSVAVESFLARNPLIVIAGHHYAGKVMCSEQITRQSVEYCSKRYQTKGLATIEMFSRAGIAEEAKKFVRAHGSRVRLCDISRSPHPARDYCKAPPSPMPN